MILALNDGRFLLAEIILTIGILVLMVLSRFSIAAQSRFLPTGISAAILIIASVSLIMFKQDGQIIGFVFDNYSHFTKLLILLCGLLILVLSHSAVEWRTIVSDEHPLSMLVVCLGVMLMLSASNFWILLLGLELAAIAMYMMLYFDVELGGAKTTAQRFLKHFVMSWGLIVLGVGIIFLSAGTLSFSQLSEQVQKSELQSFLLIGLAFIFIGFCQNISVAPFNYKLREFFARLNFPLILCFQLIVFCGVFLGLARLFLEGFQPVILQMRVPISIICIAGFISGGAIVLRALALKDLLAGLVILNSSFLLLGLASGSQTGVASTMLFIFGQIVILSTLCACFMGLRFRMGTLLFLDQLTGVSSERPRMSIALTVVLLGVAGMPPLAGFWTKLYVVSAAVETGDIWMLLAALSCVISSLLVAYLVIRMIGRIWFIKTDTPWNFWPITPEQKWIIRFGVLLILSYPILGVWFEDWAQLAAASFF